MRNTVSGMLRHESLGALPLYEEGGNTLSTLFYRFIIAVIILGMMLVIGRRSFRINSQELKVLASLGLLQAVACFTFYQSSHFMEAGIASTILFVYPVMVAIIMTTVFKEHITFSTIAAILLALAGIAFLYRGKSGITLDTTGTLLVMVSSLATPIYMVIINTSSIRISSFKLTFYVMLICVLSLLAYSFTSPDLRLQIPPSPTAWFFACWLGLIPTVLSLVLMAIAIHEVGATPTAIIGALEPLTAVAIGVIVFGESMTLRLMVGIVLILAAVSLIVLGKNFHLRTITHTMSKMTKMVMKTWRWKS